MSVNKILCLFVVSSSLLTACNNVKRDDLDAKLNAAQSELDQCAFKNNGDLNKCNDEIEKVEQLQQELSKLNN